MSITTYAELQTAIENWLHTADVNTYVPDFITLAEADMRRKLRTVDCETRATASVAAQYLAVPSDFKGIRSVFLHGSPNHPMTYKAPDVLYALSEFSDVGQPAYFTIANGQFVFAPAPDSTYTIEMIYLATLPSLSGAATTNWLLTSHPDVYLYASLAMAEPFMQNDERMGLWKSLAADALENLIIDASTRRYPGAPLMISPSVTE